MASKRIPVNLIDADPDQPRKKFDPVELEGLADSIENHGLIQPITVRSKKLRYLIIAGERRWRAHGVLIKRGLKRFASIDANVVKMGSERQKQIASILENVQRADMTPMEEASAFQLLVDTGMTPKEIATELGLADFRVTWRLQLLQLDPELRKLFEADQLDRQQALELARLPRPADQRRILAMLNRGQLVGWKAIRTAVDAVLGVSEQADIFGPIAAKPLKADIATLTAMERKIEQVTVMIGEGWKNGECIVAVKIDRDRSTLMADRIVQIQKALRTMERELRNVSAQGQIMLRETSK
jgi:ParB family chromosome partitioning protein